LSDAYERLADTEDALTQTLFCLLPYDEALRLNMKTGR